jgi:predicted CopG family antitoxin
VNYGKLLGTIKIKDDVKSELDKLKLHPREPYSDVIKRLMEKKP